MHAQPNPSVASAVGRSPYRYRVYGLTLETGYPFPLLRTEPDAGRVPDITARFGPVAPPAAPCVWEDRGVSLHADGSALLTVPGALRIAIRDGAEMLVEATPGLPDAMLHAWLFGPAMGALWHQRGTPPLHACVVAMGGLAVALAGDSGVGKSTTARALIARGHGLLSDDQAIVDPATLLVQPGWPAIKVWADTAAATGDTVDPALRVREGLDKFHLPLEPAFQREALPLGLVVVIERNGDAGPFDPDVVSWQKGAALLKRFMFRPRFGDRLDGGRAQFAWTLAVARRVPVIRLRRPDDLSALGPACDRIEEIVGTRTREGLRHGT